MDKHTEKQRRKRRRKIKRLVRRLIRISLPLVLLIIIIAVLFSCTKKDKQEKKESETQEVMAPIELPDDENEEPEKITASILTAGDIIMHDPFLTSTYYHKEDGTYDYTPIFSYISEEYGSADFTVVNLESTISDGNYSGYPRFRAPAAIATTLKANQVDMCLLANNHIYDNFDKGLTLTIDAMESNSLLYTGARKRTSDDTYFIQDINGIKVGFFNYVFDTGAKDGQTVSINAIPVSNQSAPLINTFNYGNLDALYESIRTGLEEMKESGVEYTIAYIHWGNEYQTEENRYQRTIAQELCELGINALIGGHPHVVQPVDLLTNTAGNHQMVCAYSMGNHLSNQYKERMDSMPTGHTEDGLMVKLTLEKTADGPVTLVEAEFIPTWVFHSTDNGDHEYYILPLNDSERLIENSLELDVFADVADSLNRTNAIINAGVEKVHAALPLQ